MPTIDFSAIGNVLLGGFAVTLAVVWLVMYMSAVRDLHENSPRRLN
jgi:hypothetical protein